MANPRKDWSERFDARFGVGRYRYVLTPWVWDTAGPFSFWRLPTSSVGGVDLRPLPAQAIAGGSPQGFAFAATMQPVAGIQIAHSLNFTAEQATTGMRDAWEAEMGYRPTGGPNVVDLLWDQLTDGSDPTGENGPKPLMPGVDNVLRLYVGGHSLVKSERFRWGVHPHTNRVRDLLRRQFAEQWERTNGHDHCRRCLDFTCEKYRVSDWKEFVPANLHVHVPGRLRHETTITESFPGTSATLGGDLTWAELTDAFANASGEATHTGGQVHFARAESDLSSDDHRAQLVQTGTISGERAFGPGVRFNASIQSGYYCYYYGSSGILRLEKWVSGIQTNLADESVSPSAPVTWKISIDGSTLKSFMDGVEKDSVTDTALTGDLRTGLIGYGETTGDSFEAADLAAGGVTENATPVVATSSITIPTITLSQAVTPLVSTSGVVGISASLSQAIEAVVSTTSITAPSTTLNQAGTPVVATDTIPSVSTTNSNSPSSVVATSSIVSTASSLSNPCSAVSCTGSVVSPATSLNVDVTPIFTTNSVPSVVAGRTETPNALQVVSSIIGPATSLAYAASAVSSTVTIPSVTVTGPAEATSIGCSYRRDNVGRGFKRDENGRGFGRDDNGRGFRSTR